MQIQDNIELGTNSQIGMKSIYSSSTAKINENIENDLAFNIQLVDYFIRRSYLTDLNKCEVLESSLQDTTGIRLFRISKIIYDENEDINEKLSNVYSALQNIGVSVLLFIKGTVSGVEYYLGLRGENKAGIPSGLLNDAFVANFPGSSLDRLYDSQIRELLNDQHFDNIASVTVVPSVREDNEKKFIQGIEKLIDTMQGKEYSALFISSPVSKANLAARRAGLEKLYSALSPFAKTSLSFGENESFAVTQGSFENFATTVNDNIANTLGKSETETNSNSTSYRFLFGTGFSSSSSFSSGVSASETTSSGHAETEGKGRNYSKSDTVGSNKTVEMEHTNKTVENILEYIDEQFERINVFEALGVWETAAYFCAKKTENSVIAANTFKAIVSGEKTYSENASVNSWDPQNKNTAAVAEYLKYCCHPKFVIGGNSQINNQIVTAGNYISGKELPIFMSLPQKSVSGVSVTTMAEFSRNVSYRSGAAMDPNCRKINFGCIHHMGQDESYNKVDLDLDTLTSHCFITGSTGSGKSNTTYNILQNLIQNNIPFLVVEPAKGEYKFDFGGVPDINIFTSNPYMGSMLKINPFEFDPKIHILEHLDRLIEIFNACWEMYAAMPAILKSAIEKAYSNKGWDLQNSIYLNRGPARYPTFADVLTVLPQIIKNSNYSSETQGDYTGALVTRVASLTNGITGQIFCDNYFIDDSVLFDENTIIDLSRIGSSETKSLIMGILVARLTEYRMANATGSNKSLRHVTVLEEAHHLLKNVSQSQGQQTANPVGKSVEMICNSIAEMRTYGEGFVIVDQSPSTVDPAAIRNTNTKISMRLPEQSDGVAIGNSLGLNENQIKEISKLPVGVGVVLQNNWLDAVLCKVNRANGKYYEEPVSNTFEQLRQMRSVAIESVIDEYMSTQSIDENRIFALVDSCAVSDSAKRDMKKRVAEMKKHIVNADNESYYTSLVYLAGLDGALSSLEEDIAGFEENIEVLTRWQNDCIARNKFLFVFKNNDTYARLFKRYVYAKRWFAGNINYVLVYRTLYS